MKTEIKDGTILLVAETESDRALLAGSADAAAAPRLFRLTPLSAVSARLEDLGPQARLQETPINITFDTAPPPLDLIANLAPTPFELDGRPYASVEGFWQGLKFPDGPEREQIATLAGHPAKRAGRAVAYGNTVEYMGQQARVGTIEHWALMERACEAKFTQHKGARAALLSTATRPLEHKVKVDSLTIPGIVMADIWMRLRARLAATP